MSTVGEFKNRRFEFGIFNKEFFTTKKNIDDLLAVLLISSFGRQKASNNFLGLRQTLTEVKKVHLKSKIQSLRFRL